MKRNKHRVCVQSKMLSELMGQLRAHEGLSRREVAERGGISEHTVATCERYCGFLPVEKVLGFIQGVGFDCLVVFFEVQTRLELAGKSVVSGRKQPRPGVFFSPDYAEGWLDPAEVNRQLRIMRKLRKPA